MALPADKESLPRITWFSLVSCVLVHTCSGTLLKLLGKPLFDLGPTMNGIGFTATLGLLLWSAMYVYRYPELVRASAILILFSLIFLLLGPT